ARIHRPRAHQSRRATVDHAPPHTGRDGRTGPDGGLREGFAGDRPMGDIHGLGGSPRRALMLRAGKTSVLLSVLFVFVYGGTNWLTAQRPASDVSTWCSAWE